MSYDYLFKIIIIGNSNVGKSCVITRYVYDNFSQDHDITIGVDFATKNLQVNDKKIKLHIFDTAGQEAFRSITRSYYRGSTGIIISYDVTDRKSFNSLQEWLDSIYKIIHHKPVLMLIGNKSDLQARRVVNFDEGQKFAEAHNMSFMETSAKKNNGIANVFDLVATKIVQQIGNDDIDINDASYGIRLGINESITLPDPANSETNFSKSCCVVS